MSTTPRPVMTTTMSTKSTSLHSTQFNRQQNSKFTSLPQIFRAKRMDVDCGSKICVLTHEVVDNCYLYIHKNGTDCEIPCKLEHCTKELHHFIACPIWHCHDISTTTQTTTTTQKTTTTTSPSTTTSILTTTTYDPNPFTLGPLPPLDHPGYLYGSFALNILFFLVISGMLIAKCKKALIRRFRNRNRQGQSQAADVERPIVRSHQDTSTQRRNPRNQRPAFSMDTSSSEDFDTSEHMPLIGRPRNGPRTGPRNVPPPAPPRSPRVPSFLNSPILPPRGDSLSPISSTDNFQTRLRATRATFDPQAPLTTFNPNPRRIRSHSESLMTESTV